MSVVNEPLVTDVPEIVSDPQTLAVRPTAVACGPSVPPGRGSRRWTPARPSRYRPPTPSPRRGCGGPSAAPVFWQASFAGAGPSMKWMKTNGPPTATTTTTATPATTQRRALCLRPAIRFSSRAPVPYGAMLTDGTGGGLRNSLEVSGEPGKGACCARGPAPVAVTAATIPPRPGPRRPSSGTSGPGL